MKKLFRLSCLLLAMLLIISVFAGCVTKDSGQKPATESNQGSQTPSETEPSGPSWTWDTSPWEIENWYVGVPAFNYTYDPEKTMVHKLIKEKTGLSKVDYSVSATAQNERLNAMIASNTLPDVLTVVYEQSKNTVKMMQDGGLLTPLNELMDEYAPTFKEYLNETSKLMFDWWKSSDGNFYGFPNNTYSGRAERIDPPMYQIMYARKDLMEKINATAEDFKTQDGMVEVLRKFKNAGITQDGASIYPLLMSYKKNPYDGYEFLSQHFGLANEDEQGNYVQGIKDPKFYEMVKFMNRLYREGFYTDENIIMQNKQVQEAVANNRMFLYWGHSIAHTQAKAAARNTNGEIYYLPVGPVQSNDGYEAAFRERLYSGGWTTTYISKTAKNKDRIIRLFEFLYSEEGQILYTYGIEGVTYTIDEDGKYGLTKEYNDEFAKDRAAAEEKYGMGTIWFLSDRIFTDSLGKVKSDAELVIDEKMHKDILDYFTPFIYANDANQHVFIDPEGGTPEAELNARVVLYLNDQVIKMITAKTVEEFEAVFKESVEGAEKLGLNEVWEVQNRNFQEIKKRLGVEFAFPPYRK